MMGTLRLRLPPTVTGCAVYFNLKFRAALFEMRRTTSG